MCVVLVFTYKVYFPPDDMDNMDNNVDGVILSNLYDNSEVGDI